MDIHTACEQAYKNGQKTIIEKVRKYILEGIDEWNSLGDRKYELANAQVYTHFRKCLDDLELLEKQLGFLKEEEQ